nr:hypothetical protein [Pseudobutyrivibrio sp.]
MSRESYYKFSCGEYSDELVDVVNLFHDIGWYYYNANGKVDYLPIGDIDDYDWKEESLTNEQITSIIFEKQRRKEKIGLILYEKDSGRGITFLAENTKEIILNINVYRKTVTGDSNDFIDASWYITNIFS